MRRRSREGVLATVMFTDIVGSSDVASALGDRGWRTLLARHHAIVRSNLRRFGGRELDTAGDGFFAVFERPVDAIRCAWSVGLEVREVGLDIRAGIHVGDAEVMDRKVGGVAVNVGARVMSGAGPGEVLVSATTKDLVPGGGFGFEDRGSRPLKGIPGEWRLFAVTEVDNARRTPPLEPEEAETRRRSAVEGPSRGRRAGTAALVATVVLLGALVGGGILLSGGDEPPPTPRGDGQPSGPRFEPGVLALDPETGGATQVTAGDLGGGAFLGNDLIAAGEGGVWTTAVGAHGLVHVDGDGERREIELGASRCAADLVVGQGAVWVMCNLPDQVYRVSPGGLELDEVIDLGGDVELELGAFAGLAAGEGALFAAYSRGIMRFDVATNEVDRVAPTGGQALAVGEGAVWVLEGLSGTITPLHPRTLEPLREPIEVQASVDAIAVGEGAVWLLDGSAGAVIRINPDSLALDQPIGGFGVGATDIEAGAGAVWVANPEEGAVFRLDRVTEEVTRTDLGVPVPSLAVEPDGRAVYLLVRG